MEKARLEAGKGQDSAPRPAPTEKPVVIPANAGSEEAPAPTPTSEILELSPDDLIEDFDDAPLDEPLDKDEPLDNEPAEAKKEAVIKESAPAEVKKQKPVKEEPPSDLPEEPRESSADISFASLGSEKPDDKADTPPVIELPPVSNESTDKADDFALDMDDIQPEDEQEDSPPPLAVLSEEESADLLEVEEVEEIEELDDIVEVSDNSTEKIMPPTESAITCSKCGQALGENDRFCFTCGTPIDEPEADDGQKTMFMHVGQTTEAPAEQPVAKLTHLLPSGQEGQTYNIMTGETFCGRQSGEILLDDPGVSPVHCRFFHDGKTMRVTDNGSINGVYLRIQGESILSSKSFFRIGQQLIRFLTISDFEQPEGTDSKDDTLFHGSPIGTLWGKIQLIGRDRSIVREVPLRKPSYHIGRDTGDLTFPQDGFISGSHANLSVRDEQCVLQDLGSSNGTYIRVADYTLESGDFLLIGQRLLRYETLG